MTIALQRTPPTATATQLLPAGYDGGNGSSKLVINEYQKRIPSYILPIHTPLYDAPAPVDGGLVHYLSGDRADLIGSRWLAGMPAYQQAPNNYLRVTDHKRGKVEFGLQMLLGCLASVQHRDEWNLCLVASIQDAQAFGSDLTQQIQGTHTVAFNGRSDATRITITVEAVLEEGAGAIVAARAEIDPNGQTLLYDFGNGTAIISVFGPKGKLIDRKVTLGGVEQLIDAIAKNLETRKQLAREGDRQIIRAGIESGTFDYGRSGWNFKTVYLHELKPWVSTVLATALKAADPWTPTSSAILACGGGSQLPTIAQLLTHRGISTISDGVWANARGLAKLATLKVQHQQRRGE